MTILSRKNTAWTSQTETSAHSQKQRGISWDVDHHMLALMLLSAGESKQSFPTTASMRHRLVPRLVHHGSDPGFNSERILQKFCTLTAEYRGFEL